MAFLYPITQPFKPFTYADGTPLDMGYVFFGVANQNPETVPVTMYWDVAGTIEVQQPVQVLNGFMVRGGTPANVYAIGDFSITVRDSNGTLIFNSPVSVDIQLAAAILSGTTSAGAIGISDAGNYFTAPKNVEHALQELGPLLAQMVTALAGRFQTGMMTDYLGSDLIAAAPAGWVFGSGRFICSSASGTGTDPTKTERANDDTLNLYTLLWNASNANPTLLQIYDSTGNAATTRSGSAANDFSAGKKLPLPDFRGVVRAGRDISWGSGVAGLLTVAGSTIDGTKMFHRGSTPGAGGPAETHALAMTEMPSHSHTLTDAGHTHPTTEVAHSHNYTVPTANVGFAAGGQPNNSSSFTAQATTAQRSARVSAQDSLGLTVNSAVTGITMANKGGGTAGVGPGVAHQNTQPTIITSVLIKL